MGDSIIAFPLGNRMIFCCGLVNYVVKNIVFHIVTVILYNVVIFVDVVIADKVLIDLSGLLGGNLGRLTIIGHNNMFLSYRVVFDPGERRTVCSGFVPRNARFRNRNFLLSAGTG